jgi:type IV secretion system protein VirB5
MRRVLLAASACLILATPVRAQTAVFDASNLVQQVKDYAQLLKSYGTQLSQLEQEIQTTTTVIAQLNSFVQNPNLGSAMGLMQIAGLGSSIPVNPYAVQSLINGSGGIQGGLGSLSNLMSGSFATNSVYTCTDNSWACTQAKANAAGLAGSQGIGMNAIQTLAAHIPVLQSIRTELATATTPAQRDNAMAALQTETAYAAQENTRLLAANILIESQRDIRQQQSDEKLSKDLQATIASIPN